MNDSSLKKAQDTVDRELNQYRSSISVKNKDTIEALAHLNENINWYRIKSLQECTGKRKRFVISRLRYHFSGLDERVISRRLTRYGFLSNLQFVMFLTVSMFILSLVSFYVIGYERIDFKILHFFLFFVFGLFGILIAWNVHSDGYFFRLYRVKKDL